MVSSTVQFSKIALCCQSKLCREERRQSIDLSELYDELCDLLRQRTVRVYGCFGVIFKIFYRSDFTITFGPFSYAFACCIKSPCSMRDSLLLCSLNHLDTDINKIRIKCKDVDISDWILHGIYPPFFRPYLKAL